MLRKGPARSCLAVAGCLMLGAGAVLAAGLKAVPKAPLVLPQAKLLVLKAAPTKGLDVPRPSPPPPLSAEAKTALVKGQVGAAPQPSGPFATLSPKQLEVAGKGRLAFYEARAVVPEYIELPPGTGQMVIGLECQAGRRYLVDCSLHCGLGNTYSVRSSGLGLAQDTTLSGPAHLLFVFDAPTDGHYSFVVHAKEQPPKTLWMWQVYSCEVTIL